MVQLFDERCQKRNPNSRARFCLLAIKRCGLQGKFKVWCLQFMLIPKLMWPLLVYDICCSTVELIEAQINNYLKKWLVVPPGLSEAAMYCRKAKVKLPMKSILEE
ncbi:reverse transcriptase [Elysia marginata]|uniref:Reverse transcriptase n=1 Tax=Elysia marginata TaxID=1093978 RepID=A0AAV4JPW7_9GAST|nr:reverse transcriptase [Elysia marginata]